MGIPAIKVAGAYVDIYYFENRDTKVTARQKSPMASSSQLRDVTIGTFGPMCNWKPLRNPHPGWQNGEQQ
jgi:hypothetical protein